LVPAVIISVVWTFNMFNIIYLVTGGEPSSSTEILVTQAYKFAFERYRYGYAAAYSTVIFGILLVYGVIQNRVSKATEAEPMPGSRLREEMPHGPLHLILAVATLLTLYPVFWVFSIASPASRAWPSPICRRTPGRSTGCAP